jgi:hypothetical protein
MSELLEQGIAAARAGNRAEARALLTRVIEGDERNERAWLWLSGVVDDPNDMRTCLHNVLELNPNNTQARQGLAWVDSKYGPPTPAPAAPAPAPSTPAEIVAPTPPATPYDPLASAPTSYTGPTTRLIPEEPIAEPPQAPAPAPVDRTAAVESSPTAPPENPCPYCGTPTTLTQKSCIQCRQSLMIRGAPAEKRSLPLTILGGLWIFYGVIWILAGILGTLGALLVLQAAQSPTPRGSSQAANSFSLAILIPIVIGILIGVLIIRIGRGLLRRERWAYYVVIGLSVLGLIGTICNLAQVGGMAAALRNSRATALPPGTGANVNVIIGILYVVVFVAIGLQVLYLLLVGLSHSDFFGPQVRFQPSVEAADDMTHYNNGIAYKNRGMWYMTVQEWFVASRKKPHDKTYLQALGLAYAQIKKLYPTSVTYLHDVESFLATKRADLYALAPELEQIKLLG